MVELFIAVMMVGIVLSYFFAAIMDFLGELDEGE